jgi:hypothetical protein
MKKLSTLVMLVPNPRTIDLLRAFQKALDAPACIGQLSSWWRATWQKLRQRLSYVSQKQLLSPFRVTFLRQVI